MLGRSNRKKRQGTIATLVGADTRVQGDIEFTGGLHIDGHIKGNVAAGAGEASLLSISERGFVEGTVTAAQVLLNGTVRGDVYASERVELGPRAKVIGNVKYKLIEMAMGAEVNGQLIRENDDDGAGTASETARQAPETQPETVEDANMVGEAR
jgi:cytoskeletal protein CcmA (bactofilin family)